MKFLVAYRKFVVLYWRVFNFSVRRIGAPAAIVIGTILTLQGAWSLLPGGTIDVDGRPSDDIVWRLIATLFPAAVAFLGFLIYRSDPWYPPGVDPHEQGQR